MSIKSALQTVVNDLSNLEVAVVSTEENKNDKTALTYTQLQLEGDTINWVNEELKERKVDITDLHQSMVQISQKGRLSLLKFAGTVLDSLV